MNFNMIKMSKFSIFIIGMVIAILGENYIIYSVEPIESKFMYTNWILIINSSVAAGLSVLLIVIQFQKKNGLNRHIKTHIAISIGLILWLCANIQWFIYEKEEIVPDVPSLADFFWIAAYPFLGYSVYSTYKDFSRKYNVKSFFWITVLSSTLFLIYIVHSAFNLSVFSSSRGVIFFSIIVIYPILNIILIIPAIVMVTHFKKIYELSIPRLCESLSLINLVLADSWFAIIFLSHNKEVIWYSNLLIVNHYLIISTGLLWSIAFLFDKNNIFITRLKKIKFDIRFLICVLVLTIVIVPCVFFINGSNEKTDSYKKIKIGVLLGLSGAAYESGKTQKAILLYGADKINENFSKSKINKRIELQIEKTEIKPDIALEKFKEMVHEGIRIIIGPQTSDELKKIKEYIDKQDKHDVSHNVLIISQSSTAPSLSKDDNIFRLLQSDDHQGERIAKRMWRDGIKTIVPIWRNDSYGRELYHATEIKFKKYGGNFSNRGVKYDPPLGQFAASLHRINFIIWDQELANLSKAVTEAKEKGKVGVYVISYGEFVPMFIQAPSHKDLDDTNVNWYGSEATVNNERLLKNPRALEFANKTKFLGPLLSRSDTNKKLEYLKKVTGLDLKTNDANVYDALWIASLTQNISENANFSTLKNNLYRTIASYEGASGTIKLDKNGDRIGPYDLWMIKQNITTKNYEWEKEENGNKHLCSSLTMY